MQEMKKYFALIKNSIFEEVMYVVGGNFINLALGALFWFILATLLLPESYGEINYIISIASFGGIVALSGLTVTIMTYLPKEGNIKLIEEACMLTFSLSLLISFVLIIFKLYMASLLLIAEVSLSMYLAETLGGKKYRRYAFLVIIARSSQLFLSISLFYITGTLGILVGYLIPLLLLGAPYFKSLHAKFSFSQIKAKRNFILHSYGVSLAIGAQHFLDKALVGLFFGFETLAFYQFAFQCFWIMIFFPQSLFQYLLPEEASGQSRREIELLGFMLAIVFAFGGFFLFPILIPWIFPNFQDSVVIAQVISFAVIPTTAANIKQAALFGREQSSIPLISNILAAIVQLIGLVIFKLIFGNLGLGFAIIASQTVLFISLFFLGRKTLHLQK